MRKTIPIILFAVLVMGSFMANLAGADIQSEGTWVRMRGIITHWGEDPVFGFVDAHAGMVDKNGTYHEWARVHAIWCYDPPRLNCTKPPENGTVVCYAAKLVNLKDVALNYLGYDFYVSGLWNVVKITTDITVIKDEMGKIISVTVTRTIERLLTEAPGELRVFLTPRPHFELSIEGIPLLKGLVKAFDIRHIEIKICDLNGDDKVDLIDLVKVAKRYRAVPGVWFTEETHHMDFNFNNEIDIGDLTTLAANIEG